MDHAEEAAPGGDRSDAGAAGGAARAVPAGPAVGELCGLPAIELARRIAGGLSCEAVVRAMLQRIDEREHEVGAWAFVDRDGALARARELDASGRRGPLHGIPVGVKDVIDTAGLPTEHGSPIYAGRRPRRDAECIARLKRAGAIILGKTVTAEFAFMQPGRTRNPRALDCTPGGSSSGSAAAVADSMVPIALATQTGGSTIRPAAFCGVVGYKPAFDAYPTRGLKYLAPSIDTIGVIARSVDDVALAAATLAAEPIEPGATTAVERIAVCMTPFASQAEAQAIECVRAAAAALRDAGVAVRELELPGEFGELDSLHRVIMSFQTARSLAAEWARDRDRLSPQIASFIERGLGHTAQEVDAARAKVARWKRAVESMLARGELVLTLPAPGEAPAGLASTGNSVFNRAWTLLALPCLTLPASTGRRGLPLGVQLVAAGGSQSSFLAAARWVARVLDKGGIA